MRRAVFCAVLTAVLLTTSGCGSIGKLFGGGGSDARRNSLQALVMTTKSIKLMVTGAAIAADSGAISEQTWRKVANASIRAGNGLQAWSDALRANKDTGEFQAIVAEALAVIEAVLPEPSTHSSALSRAEPITYADIESLLRTPDLLIHPDSLRRKAA